MSNYTQAINTLQDAKTNKPYGKTRSGRTYKRPVPYNIPTKLSKPILPKPLPLLSVVPLGLNIISGGDEPRSPVSPHSPSYLPTSPAYSPVTPVVEEQRMVLDQGAQRIASFNSAKPTPKAFRQLSFPGAPSMFYPAGTTGHGLMTNDSTHPLDLTISSPSTLNPVTREPWMEDEPIDLSITISEPKIFKFAPPKGYSEVFQQDGYSYGILQHRYVKGRDTIITTLSSTEFRELSVTTRMEMIRRKNAIPLSDDDDDLVLVQAVTPPSTLYNYCPHQRKYPHGKDMKNWCSECRTEHNETIIAKPGLIMSFLKSLVPAPHQERLSSQATSEVIDEAAQLVAHDVTLRSAKAKEKMMNRFIELVEQGTKNQLPERTTETCLHCARSGVCGHTRPPATRLVASWCKVCKNSPVISYYKPDICANCKSHGWTQKRGAIMLNERPVFVP